MTSATKNYIFNSQFSDLKEQDHEESTEENQSSSNSGSAKKNIDPFKLSELEIEKASAKKEKSSEQKRFNKENSHPNLIDKPGRFSLQPQPLGGMKLNEPLTPRV